MLMGGGNFFLCTFDEKLKNRYEIIYIKPLINNLL